LADANFFDVVKLQRGIRRYAPDEVSEATVRQIIEAATWAPSGSNRQPWHFIVIRDDEIKRRLGELYREGMVALGGGKAPKPPTNEPGVPPVFSDDLTSVPVVIMVCLEKWPMRGRATLLGAHIFPAVQNLMLAAAALGLGTRLTTIWQHRDAEVMELLGIPDTVEAMAMIPLGYPGGDEHLGGGKRKPIDDVMHADRW
jgi:nitroreductase